MPVRSDRVDKRAISSLIVSQLPQNRVCSARGRIKWKGTSPLINGYPTIKSIQGIIDAFYFRVLVYLNLQIINIPK